MINESDVAKAFDKLHQASQDRTWIEARLGRQTSATPTYDMRVPGTTNQFYVSFGRNGELGSTTAVDLIGVSEIPWQAIRLRRENERLVIREATSYSSDKTGGRLVTLELSYSTTITEPPASKYFRLNSATLSSANKMWVSNTSTNNVDLTNYYSLVHAGYSIYYQDKTDSTKYAVYTLTGEPVAKSGYYEFPVAYVRGAGSIINNQNCLMTIVSNKDQTLAGLSDVSITNVLDDQVLQYDSSIGKWVNATFGGGGGGGMIVHDLNGLYHTGTLPWAKIDKAGSSLADLTARSHNDLTGVGPDQHHAKLHNITDAAHHSVVGAQYSVVGLDSTNHLAVMVGSSNPASSAAFLRTDPTGGFIIGSGLFVVNPSTQKVTMEGTMFVYDGAINTLTYGAKSIFNDDATFNDPVLFTDNVTFNSNTVQFNVDPQINANLDFIGGTRNITAENHLHVKPMGDLYLESEPAGYTVGGAIPRGNVIFPDDQVVRSTTATQSITGIDGWIVADLPGEKHQLSISNILVDNLFAHKFTADEARVQRGEWYLTRSYGIVETSFTVPSPGANVDVWFEEAPGLENRKLFLPNNWIEFRTIDWGVGLVIQDVWFQVIDAGANDYVTREAQTATTPARQKWRLQRKSGGFTGAIISKGEAGADAGQPRNPAIPGDFGQGQIYASSLYEPDFGPFIKVQTFDQVLLGDVPKFLPRVQMGNLQNMAGITDARWGFAAADNLGIPPSAGMSGFYVEAKDGAKFFNTDIALYSGDGIKTVVLDRLHGLAFRFDDAYVSDDPIRQVYWRDNIDSGATGQVNIYGTVAARPGYSGVWRRLASEVIGKPGANETTEFYFRTESTGKISDFRMMANIDSQYTGIMGTLAELTVTEFDIHSQVTIGTPNWSWVPTQDRAPLHVVASDGFRDKRAGIVIEQQGTYDPAAMGSDPIGDAVVHWRFRPAADLSHSTDIWASAGITQNGLFVISMAETLWTNQAIIIDPSSGEVTIPGLDVGAISTPVSIAAGDGISISAGNTINVNSSVARTSTSILPGAGLQGGGTLAASRTLTVRALAGSGIVADVTNGLSISDTLAGTGLTWSAGKVLNINPASYVPPTTQILTPAGSGLQGGGPLSGDLSLSIKLAATDPGLSMASGLTVDGSVVRITRSITTGVDSGLQGGGTLGGDRDLSIKLATSSGLTTTGGLKVDSTIARSNVTVTAVAPINGGGSLAANMTIGLTLATNSGLDITGGLNIPTSIAGTGLQISPTKVLTVDTNVVVPVGRLINTTAPLTGGGDLSGTRTLGLAIAAPSGITTIGGALALNPAIAGYGLSIDSSQILSVNPTVIVPATRTITAGTGMTGGGALSSDLTLNVIAEDASLIVGSDNMRVNQAHTYVWTGSHTWNTGVFTFNTNPKISTNLDFIGAVDHNITTAGTTNLLVMPGGDLTLDPAGFDVYPGGNNKINLGGYARKWSTLFASELYVETLVASSVMATIGGRIIVSPTSTLLADITASATTIDLKHQFAANTYLYLETFNVTTLTAQQEAIKLSGTGTVITGGFRFTSVSRGLNAGGVGKAWTAGDSVVSFGAAVNDGYIDLASVKTAVDLPAGGQKIGPTVTIYSRSATTTWKDVAPVVSMGQLSGFIGLATSTFGFATGNDLTLSPTSGFSGLVADRVNGMKLYSTDVRMFTGANMLAEFDKSGSLQFEINSGGFGLIGWYDELGDGTGNPTGTRATIVTQTAGPAQPQSTLLLYSGGVTGTTWTEGAIRLTGQRDTGAMGVQWITANGIFFGNSSAIEAQEWGYIKPTSTYFVGKMWINTLSESTPPTSGLHVSNSTGSGVDGRAAYIRAGTGAWVSGNPETIALAIENFPSGTGFANYDQIGIDYITRPTPVHRAIALRAVGAGDISLGTGRIGINVPTGTAPAGDIDIYTTGSAAWRGINISQYTDDANGPSMWFRKTRGVAGASLVVATGDQMMRFNAYGWDGAAWREGARIAAIVNGTVGSNIMPTDLVFYTAGPTLAEEMRLMSDGKLGIGIAAPLYDVHLQRTWDGTTRLHVDNPTSTAAAVAMVSAAVNDGTIYISAHSSTAATSGAVGAREKSLTASTNNLVLRTQAASSAIKFVTVNVEQMRIDAAGNWGVNGVVPKAWSSSYQATEWFRNATMTRLSSASGYYIIDNAYFDGAWKYKAAAAASYMSFVGGALAFYVNTGSPVADGTVSWTNGYVVDVSGRMGIQQTSPVKYLHVGSGGTNPFQSSTYDGIYVNTETGINAMISARYLNAAEVGLFAHNNGNGYMGTWTNHPLVIRTNNADRITIAAGGAVTVTPAMTITGLITANGGVDYGQGTTLNYYDSGTWNVGLTINAVTTGIVISAQNGWFVRIGTMVMVWGRIQLSNKGSNVGTMRITGLPFACNGATAPSRGYFPASGTGMTAGASWLVKTNAGLTELTPMYNISTGPTSLLGSDITNTWAFEFFACYTV